jgi:hypothetical protein
VPNETKAIVKQASEPPNPATATYSFHAWPVAMIQFMFLKC